MSYYRRSQKASGCILLGRALREARAHRGLAQVALVELCQELQGRMVPVPRELITRCRLAQWENAHRQIRVGDLDTIKRALDVEIEGIGAVYRSRHHLGYYARADVFTPVVVTCRSTERVVWTSNAGPRRSEAATADEGTASPPTI